MSDRLRARVPVADELLARLPGGAEEFCRRVTGMIAAPPEPDWGASIDAPITVRAPTFYQFPEGATVRGPGYAKVTAAEPCTGLDAVAQPGFTYVWFTFEPVGPDETATDTSPRTPPDTPPG